jgi:hypothetical protein
MWAIWWRENSLAPAGIRTWDCPTHGTVDLYHCTRTAWRACIIEQYVIIVGRRQRYGIFFLYLFHLRRNINEWNTLPRENNMSANLEGVSWELAVVGWPESNSRQRQSDCIQSHCGPPTFLSCVSCPPPLPPPPTATFVKVIRIRSSPITCPKYFINFY